MLNKEKGKIAGHFSNGDEKLFKIILISSFLFYLSFALIVNTMRFPERERLSRDIKTISPRFAKLILESPKPVLKPEPKPKTEKIEPKKPPKVERKKIEEIKPKEEVKPQIEVKETLKTEEAVIEPETQKKEEVRIRLDEEAKGIEKERESRIIEEARLRAEEERRRIAEEAKRKKEENIKVAKNTGLLRLLGKKKNKNRDIKGISPEKRKKRLFSIARDLDNSSEDMEIKKRLQKDDIGMVDTQKELGVIGLRDSKDISELDADEYLKGSGGIDNIVGGIGKNIKGGTLQSKNIAVVKSPFKIKGFKGGRSPRSLESIADVVNSYKDGIVYIYNRALSENPTLKGIITVEFTITAMGNVIRCDIISSGMNYYPLEESLVKQILQWKFPPIKKGIVTVEYPIHFSPSSG
ncbi:MAG: TonB family protein [Nitrospirota bacterium]